MSADVRDRDSDLLPQRSSRSPCAAWRGIGWADLAAVLTDRHLAARLRAAWQGSGTVGSVTTGLLVGLAYYVGARLGFLLVFPGSPLSIIWPPNAIVLAALLLVSPRSWWAMLLGVLPAHLLVEWQSGVAPLAVPGLYLTNCGEALLGAAIVRRFAGGGPPWLGTLRQVAVYVIGAAIAAPFVMSFLDTGVVVLTDWASHEHYWLLWEERFISAVLTNLTVAPVILLGASRKWGGWTSISLWRGGELTLLALGILVSCYLAFNAPVVLEPATPELLYLLVPVLLWAAVRFGVGGICTSLLAVAMLAATWTDGSDFFVARAPAAAVVTLQLFLVALGGSAICLAALVQERERDAATLRKSETRYRTVVETQTELITRYQPDLTLTFVNDAACRFMGKSREELVGTRLDADLDGASAARVQEMAQMLLAQPDPGVLAIEYEAPFHDGSLHWQQWVNCTILDPDGQVLELQGIGRDITDRKRAEREREEARAQAERRAEELDRVFEAMGDGVAVYDQDGREVRTNKALQRLIGIDVAPLHYAHMPLQERMALFAARDEHGRPLDPSEGPLPRALRGEVVSGAETQDMRSRTLDGREIEVSVSAATLHDSEGHATGAVAVFHDQTARRKLEREVAEQAERLNRIVEAMGEGLFVYDTQGQLMHTNAAARRLLGVEGSEDAFLRLPAAERLAAYVPRDSDGHSLSPAEWPVTRAQYGGAELRDTEVWDLRMRTVDGRELDVSATMAPLRDPDGQGAGAVMLLSDRTERNQLVRDREAALAQAQARSAELEAAFGAMTDGVVVYDPTGQISYMNAAFGTMIAARERPDFARLSLAERAALVHFRAPDGHILPVDQLPQARVLRGEALSTGEAADLVVDALDGHTLMVQAAGSPLRDAAGSITGAVLVYRDVTEQRRLERDRDEQAAQLDRIFTGISDGLVVYNAEGHVVRTNPAARHLLGFDTAPDGYAKSSVADRAILYGARDNQGRPLPPEAAPLSRVLRGEVANGSVGCEVRLRSRDGREAEVYASAAPLRDADGRLLGAVSILHDQTERNRLLRDRQAALEASEVWFHTLADTVPALVWVSGLDALVTFVNQPWLQFTGRTQEQEVGNGWAEGVHPEDFDRCLQTYLTAFRAREPFAMEYRLRRADGEYRWLLDTGVPRAAPDGTFAGYIGSCIDITERHELEQVRASELALREVNERLDTFVSIAAHELRRPVGVSKMVVAEAQRRLLRAAAGLRTASGKQIVSLVQVETALDTTRVTIDTLWRLMQQLLDVTRARQGTLVLDRHRWDLGALVRGAVEEQRLLNPDRVLNLALPAADDPSFIVFADADRIGHVLANYLANAIRYSPDDQPIEVRLELARFVQAGVANDDADGPRSADDGAATMVRVEVGDHGPGIAPEEQRRIWDRFQRARNAFETSGGLGLGLYIARTIIDLHGGEVGVESQIGEGARFWFTVPLAPLARDGEPIIESVEMMEGGQNT